LWVFLDSLFQSSGLLVSTPCCHNYCSFVIHSGIRLPALFFKVIWTFFWSFVFLCKLWNQLVNFYNNFYNYLEISTKAEQLCS
jgi:hypothetical protein